MPKFKYKLNDRKNLPLGPQIYKILRSKEIKDPFAKEVRYYTEVAQMPVTGTYMVFFNMKNDGWDSSTIVYGEYRSKEFAEATANGLLETFQKKQGEVVEYDREI